MNIVAVTGTVNVEMTCQSHKMNCEVRIQVVRVSDQVQHKLGCTVTKAG